MRELANRKRDSLLHVKNAPANNIRVRIARDVKARVIDHKQRLGAPIKALQKSVLGEEEEEEGGGGEKRGKKKGKCLSLF